MTHARSIRALTFDLLLHLELEDGLEERGLSERDLTPQHERQHLLLYG
jgi:hypothetical protein